MVFRNKKVKIFLFLTFVFVLFNCVGVFAGRICQQCRQMGASKYEYEDSELRQETRSRLGDTIIEYRCPNGHLVYSSMSEVASSDYFTDEEIKSKFGMLHTEIRDIFMADNAGSDSGGIWNTRSMMEDLSGNLLGAVESWGGTTLYNVFIGIGVFLLFVSFVMSFYSNSMNREGKTIEQYTRMFLQFIIAFFIIANVNKLATIIVNIFTWTMSKAWGYQQGSVSNPDGSMSSTIDTLFIELIKNEGLNKASILDQVFNAVKYISLVVKFLIPWLVSLIGKFGILFAVIKCELTIFINVMLYPIAAHDCFDNIKQSNFLKYTKKIASSSLELTIIVLVMIASNTLLQGYMNSQLSGVDTASSFNIGLVAAVFQLSKMVVATSVSSAIASSVFGG